MRSVMHTRRSSLISIGLGALALLAVAGAASAVTAADNGRTAGAPGGPPAVTVPTLGPWQEFGFDGPGTWAYSCPACTPSSAGNSTIAGDPPWTFVASPGGADITVVDAFNLGDRFDVYDWGNYIGSTSVPATTGSCGSDPVVCLADPGASKGVFKVGPGPHSIEIQMLDSPFEGGAAYFKVDQATRFAQIPTLGAVGLGLLAVALGLMSLLILRRRRA